METVNEAVTTRDALLDVLSGTDKPYLTSGGTGLWIDTGFAFPERVVTEADPISPPPRMSGRPFSLYALTLRTTDVRGLHMAATDTVQQMDVAKAVSAAAGLGGEVELVDCPTMRELNGRLSELDF